MGPMGPRRGVGVRKNRDAEKMTWSNKNKKIRHPAENRTQKIVRQPTHTFNLRSIDRK